MKMAKANETDLEVAMELCGALDSLTGWCPSVPAAVEQVADPEAPEPFDKHDREQCARVLGYLLDLADRASLMRVVWGCAVMLDPRNKCVDPDAGVIEHHPDAKAGFAAKQARPLAEWYEDIGPALWWSFPVCEPPWVGRPIDDDWQHHHTHWTPLTVPNQPAAEVAPPHSTADAVHL
jgi:hypothetical protein